MTNKFIRILFLFVSFQHFAVAQSDSKFDTQAMRDFQARVENISPHQKELDEAIARAKSCDLESQNNSSKSNESYTEQFLAWLNGTGTNDGMTVREAFHGNEQKCLEKAGLLIGDTRDGFKNVTETDINKYFRGHCAYTHVQLRPDENDREIGNLITFSQDALLRMQELRADIEEHVNNRDRLTNIVWEDIARRSHAQIVCRQKAIDLAVQEGSSHKRNLLARAEAQYEEVVDDIRALLLKKQLSRQENTNEVKKRICANGGCSGVAWFYYNEVIKAQTARDDTTYERQIAARIARLPYGHNIDVATAIIKMANGSEEFDKNSYINALLETRKRYDVPDAYYRHSFRVTDPANDRGSHCLDDEFREKAMQSGVGLKAIESLVRAGRMKQSTANYIFCKMNSKYNVSVEGARNFNNNLFLVGGGLTAVLTAIPSGGGSLAAYAAAGSIAISATAFATQLGYAFKACNAREFILSPTGAEVCEPEQDFEKELNKFSMASCVGESALAMVELAPLPFDLRTIMRATRGKPILRLINDVEIESGVKISGKPINLSISRADAKAKLDRPRYVGEEQKDKIFNSLTSRGMDISSETYRIDPSQLARLKDKERVVAFEEIAFPVKSLTPDMAKTLRKDHYFSSSRDARWLETRRSRLEEFLRQAGVPEAQLAQTTERVLDSGILGRAPAARRIGSEVAGSLDNLRSLKNANEMTPEELFALSRMSDEDRIRMVETATGVKPSSEQAAELMRAHNIGEGFGKYSQGEITAKGRILYNFLKTTGKSDSEIREITQLLLDKGIFGRVSPSDVKGSAAVEEANRMRDRIRELERSNASSRTGVTRELSDQDVSDYRLYNQNAGRFYEEQFIAAQGDPRFLDGAIQAYTKSGDVQAAKSLILRATNGTWEGVEGSYTTAGMIRHLKRDIESFSSRPGLTQVQKNHRDNLKKLLGELEGGTAPTVRQPTPSARPAPEASVRTPTPPAPTPPKAAPARSPNELRIGAERANAAGDTATARDLYNQAAKLYREKASAAIDDITKTNQRGIDTDYLNNPDIANAIESSLRSGSDDLLQIFNRIAKSGEKIQKPLNSFYNDFYHRANWRRLSSKSASPQERQAFHRFLDEVEKLKNNYWKPDRLSDMRKSVPRE